MRAGFGILSILIVAAIFFYISFGGKNGGEMGVTLQANKNMHEQADQITGHTEDGVPIADTIQFDEVNVDGQLRRLKVISIVPQTPMETAYGLKAGDEISRIGDIGVRDNNDPSLAKAMVVEAYSRNQPLVILRNGEEITLNPDTALTKFHPNLFAKPSAVVSPNSPTLPTGVSVPSH